MCAEHSEAAIEAFRRVKVAFDTYISERMRLHATFRAEIPALLEAALEGSSRDVALAFELLPGLTVEERKGLLRQFVELCSDQSAGRAKAAILDLPNDWLRDNVEAAAERLLAGSDYMDWANLLALVSRIDPGVEKRIAERAARHGDSEIRELGEEHLSKTCRRLRTGVDAERSALRLLTHRNGSPAFLTLSLESSAPCYPSRAFSPAVSCGGEGADRRMRGRFTRA